jgi:hypothetical protein
MGKRLVTRSLKPVAQAGPYVDLAQIVAQLVPRVRNLHHQLRSNVYVIADRQGRIFLLSEAASTAPQILKHVDAADLVGVYTRPTRAQLFEDLAKHLCENGVVSEQLIYEAVRQVEG